MPKLVVYASIAVCCFGIAMAIYTADISRFFMHLGSDSKACINCHNMNTAYTTWEHSIHGRNVVCIDCHLPRDFVSKYITKAKDGLHHVYMFTFDKYGQSIEISDSGAKTVQGNCIACHEIKTEAIVLNATMNAHKDKDDYCWRCHRDTAHSGIGGINMTPDALGVKNLK
ncbi:cytochrome c nitrite reductase small subunit [Campylobacter sp. faydin G-24]|uniref:Cytochrome c nitrite reductase small subunit n=1 Tax=Campylobacter anatolicus TaxID=2829105 RepID=A0ABS5HIE1_9BACT|nr:cytochrome c nitrite reductase small subunit [Campylobacter anatolicus]MBR8461625.1 cytochrome c nitrite reductase small subunit [Campylobacter anatolicus]MBR8463362.1 cytochrome c nitrite reductase small subunit [Campylobacter anatolicus]MBR8465286.1 cytochrome c nitrite reductase small subunit [Campylobacter anatolicus]